MFALHRIWGVLRLMRESDPEVWKPAFALLGDDKSCLKSLLPAPPLHSPFLPSSPLRSSPLQPSPCSPPPAPSGPFPPSISLSPFLSLLCQAVCDRREWKHILFIKCSLCSSLDAKPKKSYSFWILHQEAVIEKLLINSGHQICHLCSKYLF